MQNEIEVPQDLVEKIARAMQKHWQSCSLAFQQFPGTDERVWTQVAPTALRVALEDERVLGEPSVEEIAEDADSTHICWFERDYAHVRRLFANRRARLLKPKTPEERVTICGNTALWHVERDDLRVISLRKKEDAEIYRLGLIAKLKAEQEAQS